MDDIVKKKKEKRNLPKKMLKYLVQNKNIETI